MNVSGSERSIILFQELNNKEIADYVEAWLKERGSG